VLQAKWKGTGRKHSLQMLDTNRQLEETAFCTSSPEIRTMRTYSTLPVKLASLVMVSVTMTNKSQKIELFVIFSCDL
jgi:hypothetical protein